MSYCWKIVHYNKSLSMFAHDRYCCQFICLKWKQIYRNMDKVSGLWRPTVRIILINEKSSLCWVAVRVDTKDVMKCYSPVILFIWNIPQFADGSVCHSTLSIRRNDSRNELSMFNYLMSCMPLICSLATFIDIGWIIFWIELKWSLLTQESYC